MHLNYNNYTCTYEFESVSTNTHIDTYWHIINCFKDDLHSIFSIYTVPTFYLHVLLKHYWHRLLIYSNLLCPAPSQTEAWSRRRRRLQSYKRDNRAAILGGSLTPDHTPSSCAGTPGAAFRIQPGWDLKHSPEKYWCCCCGRGTGQTKPQIQRQKRPEGEGCELP